MQSRCQKDDQFDRTKACHISKQTSSNQRYAETRMSHEIVNQVWEEPAVEVARSFVLNCTENNDKAIISHIEEGPQTMETQCVVGPYDIFVKVESPTLEETHKIITEKICTIKDVRTNTLEINEEVG